MLEENTDSQAQKKESLEKRISYPTLFFLIINSILGTGVFFSPAITTSIAKSYVFLAWVIVGLFSILLSSMFGELVERIPSAGGMYEYTKQAFGRFPSFIIGWLGILGSNITISMLIVGAIKYLNPQLPTMVTIIFGLILIWMFALLASRGLKTSIFMLLGFALITFGTIVFSVILGFTSNGNFNGIFTEFPGVLPLFLAIFIAADTFFGWESATYLSEETKNVREVMPKALRRATILIVFIVWLLILSLIYSLGINGLEQSQTPIYALFTKIFSEKAGLIISSLIYLAILGSVADWVVSSPRLLLAMARDREMITQLADIDKKTRVPKKAIWFQAVFSSIILMIGVGTYRVILETLIPLTIITYTVLAIVLLKLRRKQEYKPKYGIYLGNIGIYIIILFNLLLLASWLMYSPYSLFISINLIILVFFAIPLFLMLNSFYNPDIIRKTPHWLLSISQSFEFLFLPKRIKHFIIELLQGMKGKTLIEFGTIGLFTSKLREIVGSNGVIYSIDLNEKNITDLQKKIKDKNIKIIHDPHMYARIHPSISKVDGLLSIGVFGHISNLDLLLKEMKRVIREGGKIIIVDYIDYFKILPNPEIFRDINKLREIFKRNGFRVRIKIEKGLFWNYIIIYGIRTNEEVNII